MDFTKKPRNGRVFQFVSAGADPKVVDPKALASFYPFRAVREASNLVFRPTLLDKADMVDRLDPYSR